LKINLSRLISDVHELWMTMFQLLGIGMMFLLLHGVFVNPEVKVMIYQVFGDGFQLTTMQYVAGGIFVLWTTILYQTEKAYRRYHKRKHPEPEPNP